MTFRDALQRIEAILTWMRRPSLMPMLMVVALGACGGESVAGGSSATTSPGNELPSASSRPAPSHLPSMPTASLSAPATVSATASPKGAIEIGSIASVATSDLRVRSRPEVSDASKKLAPLLQSGQALFIVDGPVSGSGYRWYLVQPLGGPIDNGSLPFGWVAEGDKTGVPWLEPGGFHCPNAPTTFNEFASIEPIVALACFGRKPLTFPARIADPEATCGTDVGWTIEPEWLGSTCSHPKYLVFDAKSKDNYFDSVIEPSLDTSGLRPGTEEKDWIRVNLTGSFDHPAASTCQGKVTEASAAPPPERDEIILSCRSRFVITAIERA